MSLFILIWACAWLFSLSLLGLLKREIYLWEVLFIAAVTVCTIPATIIVYGKERRPVWRRK
jgi:hypothetical protein